MNNLLVLGLIFGVIMGVGASLLVGIPLLKKKGIDVSKCINGAKEGLDIADKTVNVVSEVLPNNNVVTILKTIVDWSKLAVGNAEQLWLSNDLDKDKRKETAQNVVYAVLNEIGIEVTDNRKLLIDAAIHDFVKELGHNKTDAEKQAMLQDLQIKLNTQTQDNDQLKQIINQIQGTVATALTQV